MRTKKLYQGIFKPKNPSKYTGDVNNIIEQSRLIIKLDRTAKLSTYLIQNKVKSV